LRFERSEIYPPGSSRAKRSEWSENQDQRHQGDPVDHGRETSEIAIVKEADREQRDHTRDQECNLTFEEEVRIEPRSGLTVGGGRLHHQYAVCPEHQGDHQQ
jgi:hypothetical protein